MIDGGAYSIMVGLGEYYLPAFVLALALGEVASGLIATVPMLAGAGLQLAGFAGVRLLGSHKRWVLAVVAVQALAFVPLMIGAAAGAMPLWAVFACATMYWAGGMAGGAAWSTWIGGVVPGRCRSRFFSRRQRLLQAGTLAGFLGAGFALYAVSGGLPLDRLVDPDRRRIVLWTFAGLFGCAAVCRGVSCWFLMLQSEPARLGREDRVVGPRELWGRLRAPLASVHGRDARLITYMLAVSLGAQVSSPFVTPYVLKQLGHDFFTYAWLIGLVPLAKVLALGPLGHVAARVGARRVLLAGGLAVVPISALWTVSENLWWLGGMQTFSGIAWAAYELGTFLLILEHLKPHERTSLMSTYNLGNAACVAAGSLLGGWLLAVLGADGRAYLWAFWASTALRALTIVPLVALTRRDVLPAAAAQAGATPTDSEAWPDRAGVRE